MIWDANSYYDPEADVYHLAKDATGDAYAYVLTHESIHEIKVKNPEAYNTIEAVVEGALIEGYMHQDGLSYDDAKKKVNELIEYQMDAHGLSRSDAETELIANTVPAILTDEKQAKRFTDRIVNSDSTVREWFKSIIEKIRSILKKAYDALKREKSREQMEIVRTQQKAVDLIAELYFDALESTKDIKTIGNSLPWGLEGYSEKEIGKITKSPNNILASSETDILKFYDNIANSSSVQEKLYCGKIDRATASRIKQSTGKNLYGASVIITSQLEKSHFNANREASRGQVAITPQILAKLPEALHNFISVKYDGLANDGREAFIFELEISGKKIAVEYYSAGKNALTLQTIYGWGQKKNPAVTMNAKADIRTSETTTVLDSYNRLSNKSQNVKQSSKNSAEQTATTQKEAQFTVIQNSNAAQDDYHTWIRSADEIKTLEETLTDPEWSEYTEYDPDYTRQMAEEAVQSGNITVYSSNKIGNGVFVSPSKMEAESYSASGKVYSKTVNINDIAWIDPTQGQYAPIDSTVDTNTNPDIRFSRKDGTPATEKDVQELQRRNDSLKKQLAIAKQEIKLSGGHKIKPTVIDGLAGKLAKEYSSSIDKADLAAHMQTSPRPHVYGTFSHYS